MFKGRSPSDITIDNCQCSCLFVLLITSIQLKVFKKPRGGYSYDFKAPEGWLQMRILRILELWRRGVTQQTIFIVCFSYQICENKQPTKKMLAHSPRPHKKVAVPKSMVRVIYDVKNPTSTTMVTTAGIRSLDHGL